MRRSATSWLLLIIGGAFVLTAGCENPAYTRIRIGGVGWRLIVDQDGGGQYGFGSSAADFIQLPTGTFEFDKVIARLKPSLAKQRDAKHHHMVLLQGPNWSDTRWSDDDEALSELFDTARRVAPLPERLRKLWDDLPPTRRGA